ncbi:putative chitinase 1 isoform X2 [Rhipicephalus microplus]|uniref:putative chitinase 1 isoform X2 n=1 Tax=Rhipicephalus microplus TaxID=6941 RepID=UPI003F6D9FBB
MELLLPPPPSPPSPLHWALAALWTCCFWHLARSFQQVCYLVAPTNSTDSLPIASVNVQMCSHVIMGFGTVDEDGSINLDALGGPQGLASLVTLRKRRPDIKLMISIGGGGGEGNFRTMVSSADSRWRFIASAISALRAARLDGLDIDWEFPKLLDAARFARLLKTAFMEFKKEAYWPLLLSVAVPAQSLLVIGAYDVYSMARSVDFVNLMTYDLNIYNWYTPWVRHNSPLFPNANDAPYFNTLNVVCRLLKNGAQREYDPEAMVPYLHQEKLWVSYDDQQSVAVKASWIVSNGYGGIMTFSLNADDWAGVCGDGRFPLQRSIASAVTLEKAVVAGLEATP